MENLSIHIDASLKKGKLVFKRGRSSVLSIIDFVAILFFEIVITFIFPFIAIVVFLNHLEDVNESIFYFLLATLSVLVSTYMSLSLFFNNRLKKVKGISGSKNRAIIKQIFKKSDWKQRQHNQEITILKKGWNWTSAHYGRQFTILYDGKNLFINCATFTRHHSRSPFHWYFDRKVERKFIVAFEKHISQ